MFDTRGGECDSEHLVAITTFVRPRKSEGTLIQEILSSAGLSFCCCCQLWETWVFLTKRSLHRSHLQNNHILLPYHQNIKHQAIDGEIKTYFTATRRVPGSAGEMSPFSFSEDSLRFLTKHLPPFIFSALSTFAHFYHLLHGGSNVSVENIPNISASIKDTFCPLPFLVFFPVPFFSLFLLSHRLISDHRFFILIKSI